MSRLAMAAVFLALFTASAFAQNKATIQKLNQEWAAAFNRGDAVAVAAMYAEDAYVLPAGAELVHGRAGVEALMRKTAEQLGDARLTAVDVQPLGSGAAREIGTFAFKTKGQSPQEVTGKYAVVWRKIAGRWKLSTDIWNMNK
jgi:uncharacterized protein (TIGR02246 family)